MRQVGQGGAAISPLYPSEFQRPQGASANTVPEPCSPWLDRHSTPVPQTKKRSSCDARESNPWHDLYSDLCSRSARNDAKSAVARNVLTAAWHMLSLQQPFKPSRPRGGLSTAPASSISVLAA